MLKDHAPNQSEGSPGPADPPPLKSKTTLPPFLAPGRPACSTPAEKLETPSPPPQFAYAQWPPDPRTCEPDTNSKIRRTQRAPTCEPDTNSKIRPRDLRRSPHAFDGAYPLATREGKPVRVCLTGGHGEFLSSCPGRTRRPSGGNAERLIRPVV